MAATFRDVPACAVPDACHQVPCRAAAQKVLADPRVRHLVRLSHQTAKDTDVRLGQQASDASAVLDAGHPDAALPGRYLEVVRGSRPSA